MPPAPRPALRRRGRLPRSPVIRELDKSVLQLLKFTDLIRVDRMMNQLAVPDGFGTSCVRFKHAGRVTPIPQLHLRALSWASAALVCSLTANDDSARFIGSNEPIFPELMEGDPE